MPALTPLDLLAVWEDGAGLPAAERAVLLLTRTAPLEASGEDVWALPLGERDARLLRLRAQLFGDRLEAWTECPACGERLEFGLSCADLLASPAAAAPDAAARQLVVAGHAVTLRPFDSRDAAAAGACESVDAARTLLLDRGVATIDPPVAASTLPPDARAAIAERMAALDPRADVLLDLTCPACAHAWQSPLDIVSALWSELRGRVQGLLLDVDALARAYGWSERTILDLSDVRRRLYVQMAAS